MTEITERELRDDSDAILRRLDHGEAAILRRLDHGEAFVVTRQGVPVAELTPMRLRSFVPAAHALAVFAGAVPVSYQRLRGDLDAVVDQDGSGTTSR